MSGMGMRKQLSAACHFAQVRLALNEYMAYEIFREAAPMRDGGRIRSLQEEFLQYLGDFLEGSYDCEALDEFRLRVVKEMELLSSYTDSFQAYEYVLNRLEGRFAPRGGKGRPEEISQLLQEISQYIQDGDNEMEANARIREIVRELPVRLTKEKFFSMTEQGLSIYKDGPKESFDSVLYIIRAEALLNRPEGLEEKYPGLEEELRCFQKADYRALTPEEFRDLMARLEAVGEELSEKVNDVMLLMDRINDLYVLDLTRPCTPVKQTEEQACQKILGGIRELFLQGTKEEISQDITQLLSSLEGRQEYWMEQWNAGLSSPEVLESEPDEQAELFTRVAALLSGSMFMSLQREPEGEVVDEALFSQTMAELRTSLEESMKSQPKVLNRAVMAKVLSSLPRLFRSLDEVTEYVRGSLESCTDIVERETSIQMIRLMMEQ